MNLQLNSPYKPCPYKCPYCCAGYEGDKSLFQDDEETALYFTDKEEYMRRLRNVLMKKPIDTVVITGSTEPTLFPQWIKDVLRELRRLEHPLIEVATHYKCYYGNKYLQTIAYSFSEIPKDRLHVSKAQNTRAVFILHDGMSLNSIIEYHRRSGGQTTVKNLAWNSYGNKRTNDWTGWARDARTDERKGNYGRSD